MSAGDDKLQITEILCKISRAQTIRQKKIIKINLIIPSGGFLFNEKTLKKGVFSAISVNTDVTVIRDGSPQCGP